MSDKAQAGVVQDRGAAGGKTALNFWVDFATAMLFAALLGSAALMKWILPPGTCDAPGVKTWLGHSRHWWGDIHFWVAVALLALSVIHVWLHWSWVCSVWSRLIGPLRSPRTWAAVAPLAALIAVPFIIPAQYLAVPPEPGALAAEPSAAAEPALSAVAPCGVEGLSCEDCPAADDRLFGGTCVTKLVAEQQEAAAQTADGNAEAEDAGAADGENAGEADPAASGDS